MHAHRSPPPPTAIIKLRPHRHQTLIGTARHMLRVLLSQRTFARPNNHRDIWHCAMQAGGSSEALNRATLHNVFSVWNHAVQVNGAGHERAAVPGVKTELLRRLPARRRRWLPAVNPATSPGSPGTGCRRSSTSSSSSPAPEQPAHNDVTLTLVFNRGQRDACVIRSCRLAEKKTYLAEQVDVGVRIAPAPK